MAKKTAHRSTQISPTFKLTDSERVNNPNPQVATILAIMIFNPGNFHFIKARKSGTKTTDNPVINAAFDAVVN